MLSIRDGTDATMPFIHGYGCNENNTFFNTLAKKITETPNALSTGCGGH
jgi:hypothetical protein